jgi:hypothetical protein
MVSDEQEPKRPKLKWLDANYDRFKRSKKHENRLASRLGGRRLPQSGAKRLSKYTLRAQTDLSKTPETITQNGDLALPDFWVEHKRTETGTMSIKKDWWLKVKEGAKAADREPALIVTFEEKASPSSKPIDLVLIPLEVFERMRGPK